MWQTIILDNSCTSNVEFRTPGQQRPCHRSSSSIAEEPEIVSCQPHHSDDVLCPVIPPPVNRYSSSCSSFFCCRVWNSSIPEKVCSVCKKPISKYMVHYTITRCCWAVVSLKNNCFGLYSFLQSSKRK